MLIYIFIDIVGRRKCAKGRMKPVETVDDGASDAPKMKDSKLSKEFKGKLSHASPQVSNQPITKFFSPQEVTKPELLVDAVDADLMKENSNVSVEKILRQQCNGASEYVDSRSKYCLNLFR